MDMNNNRDRNMNRYNNNMDRDRNMNRDRYDRDNTCEELGHIIVRICGEWCATCRDFPKIWVNNDPMVDISISKLIEKD